MRIPAGAVAALLTAAPSLWCQSGRCVVDGRVVNATTGEPVAAASVTAIPTAGPENSSGIQAATDERGRFALSGLARGEYVLVVKKAGFVNSYGPDGHLNTSSAYTIENEERPTEIVIRLSPNGTLAGRIENENGDPVPGAFVLAYRVTPSSGGKRLMLAGRESARDDGRYRIADLAPGRYYLAAVEPDAFRQRGGFAASYYPGTRHLETAAPLEIAPGTSLPNLTLKLVRVDTECARIQLDRPGPGVEVAIGARSSFAPNWMNHAAPLREAGLYEACGLLPGPYFAIASKRSGYVSRQAIDVDRTDGRVFALPLIPQADVAGSVVFEDQPLKEAPPISVRLRPHERSAADAPGTTLNHSLSFALKNINPDRYRVSASNLPRGYYVKAIRSGKADVLASGLEVAGSSPDPLEIVLSPNVGSVVGTAERRNGEPARRGIVLLIPEEPERRGSEMFFKADMADANGGFTIPDVAPGRYRGIVFERAPETGALLDPENVARLLEKGEAVEVREKNVSRARLFVLPASEMQGL